MREVHACLSLLLFAILGERSAVAETGHDAAWRWHGKGVQLYDCALSDGRYGWKPAGPDAVLTDEAGQVRGRHFAGPSWQALDGSRVIGAVVQSIPAPRADAVPWLVLAARTHAQPGILDRVAFILRLDTVGGVPVPGRCADSSVGTRAKVPYEATYVFVPAPEPGKSGSSAQ